MRTAILLLTLLASCQMPLRNEKKAPAGAETYEPPGPSEKTMMRKLTRADFERPVVYRGITIEPLPREYYGEPSALVLWLRDCLIEKHNREMVSTMQRGAEGLPAEQNEQHEQQ
jgi:hypothetical protein